MPRGVLRRAASIDPRRTHQIFMLLAIAAGGAVGIGAILFMPRLPLLDQAFLGVHRVRDAGRGVVVSQSRVTSWPPTHSQC